MDAKTYISKLKFVDLDSHDDEYGEEFKGGWREPVFYSPRTEESDVRLPRLAQAWGHACAAVNLMSAKYKNLFTGAVLEMGDRKGTLEVLWRDDLSRLIFEGVLVGGWEANAEYSHAHGLATDDDLVRQRAR